MFLARKFNLIILLLVVVSQLNIGMSAKKGRGRHDGKEISDSMFKQSITNIFGYFDQMPYKDQLSEAWKNFTKISDMNSDLLKRSFNFAKKLINHLSQGKPKDFFKKCYAYKYAKWEKAVQTKFSKENIYQKEYTMALEKIITSEVF